MLKHLFFISILFVLLLPFKVNSLEVKDLYQARVSVESQASTHRQKAIKEALRAVMVKVGGETTVLTNKILKNAVKKSNNYITQYRYTRKNGQLYLVANFNEDKINQLFQQANLAIWGSLRPQVLLWLIDEQGLSRTIMSNSMPSNLPILVNDFSSQRGLPVVMPLMDLTDATQVNLSDLWGRFEQPIYQASERYFAEAIVVMRLSDSSLLIVDELTEPSSSEEVEENTDSCGLLCVDEKPTPQYVLDWVLFSQNQRFTQVYQGEDREVLTTQALSDITELIYQKYALSATSDNEYIIEVANVDSLKVYTELFDFLSNLSAVKSVTLLNAKGATRQFKLKLLGSESALLASLKLNKQLKQYIDPLAVVDPTAIPIFHWEQ